MIKALEHFLAEAGWVERFGDEARMLGGRLVSKVQALKLDGDEEIQAQARVLGEKTEAAFWQQGGQVSFETDCSCEAGAFCEHGFALLGKMAKSKHLEKSLGRTPAEAVAMELGRGAGDTEIKESGDAKMEGGGDVTFELVVRKDAVDKATLMLLKSMGQEEPKEWIFAEAFVSCGDQRKPLASAREDGRTPREQRAMRELRDIGLSSMQTNPAWRFLLSMISRSVEAAGENDKWFPDPGRIPVDTFWHQFRGEFRETLEASGWKVKFEEGVGHQVHDADPEKWQTRLTGEQDDEPYVGDFSDGGWFSLSVGFDVDGERYDLMPILAGLLKQDFLEETLDRPNQGFVYAPLPNGDALKLPIGRVRRLLRHL